MKSCIGKHVEPCYRYHQQLHFVQKSHECFACSTAHETHLKRHKEIALLIKSISKYDSELAATKLLPSRKKPRSNKDDHLNGESHDEINHLSDNISHLSSEDLEPISKKQRKTLKAERKGIPKEFEIITAEVLDDISEAIHQQIITGKAAAFTIEEYEMNETVDAGGMNPAIVQGNLGFSSMYRNKCLKKRNAADEETTQAVLSPTPHTPVPSKTVMTTPKSNKKRPFSPRPSKNAFGKIPKTPTIVPDALTSLDPAIFVRLGIPVYLQHDNSKKRKDLIGKLASAVCEDIEINDREDREAYVREAGFWRFVNKTTMQNMCELHVAFSWSTGEIRKEKRWQDMAAAKAGEGTIPEVVIGLGIIAPNDLTVPVDMETASKVEVNTVEAESSITYAPEGSSSKLEMSKVNANPVAVTACSVSLLNSVITPTETTTIPPPQMEMPMAWTTPVRASVTDQATKAKKVLRVVPVNVVERPPSPGWTTVSHKR
jgi:hypothetical protein